MTEPRDGGGKGKSGKGGKGAHRGGEAVPIGDLVQNLLRSPAHRQRRALYEQVTPLLRERLGDLADDLTPLSLRSGCLSIGVRSAPLLHELAAFRVDDLLAFLQGRLGPEMVRAIRFRHTPA